MKSIFSHITSILIWVITIFTISMILVSGMKITNAGQFHAQVIDRIETSYYSHSVIQECIEKADEYGYELTVEDKTIYEDRKDVKVSLTYSISIPLFNLSSSETLVGYAR